MMTYPTHFLYCNNDTCDTILKLELYQFLIFINFGKCNLLRKACGIMRKFPCPKYLFSNAVCGLHFKIVDIRHWKEQPL